MLKKKITDPLFTPLLVAYICRILAAPLPQTVTFNKRVDKSTTTSTCCAFWVLASTINYIHFLSLLLLLSMSSGSISSHCGFLLSFFPLLYFTVLSFFPMTIFSFFALQLSTYLSYHSYGSFFIIQNLLVQLSLKKIIFIHKIWPIT